jgi:hypothetical protein
MKAKVVVGVAVLSVLMLSGCASGLNSVQKREYSEMETDNVIVEEKNPTSGAWLGLLPGGGSFYAREPGWGIVNLLLWPLSILWDPVSGYEGSQKINYEMTKHKLERTKEEALLALDEQQASGKIDDVAFVREKKRLHLKYDY